MALRTPPSRELLGPYSEALRAYLTEGQESNLRRARELGHTAVEHGVCAAEMCALYHESVRQILAGFRLAGECPEGETSWDPQPCEGVGTFLRSLTERPGVDAVTAAATFFGESISPFDASQRELRASNTALRYHNSKLEGEIHGVSRLVHDQAMQLLAAARLAMACAADEATAPAGMAEVQFILQQLEDHLELCASTLWPRVLEDLGISAAIHSLTRRFCEDTALDVTAVATVGPLPPEIGLAVYRAVLEALTNVVRHAQANCVEIHLCEECSVIRCSIRDDGVGFDSSGLWSGAEGRGSGLSFISENLRSIGGTLTVNSVPGGGTEVHISICKLAQNGPE